MKVNQFCVIFTLRSGLLTPLGFELVTVLWTFYSESLFRSLFKSSVVLVQFLKKITENQMCLHGPFCVRKMIDQVFFRYYQAEIRTCSLFELVRGSKRDPSQWLWFLPMGISILCLFCRMDVLLFFHRELFSVLCFQLKDFYKPLLRAMWLNRCSRI